MPQNNSTTITICTTGREGILEQTINSILQENHYNWPILIIDNNPDELPIEISRRLLRLPSVFIVHESLPTLSAARNRGLKEADTPWVIYLDDDILLPSNFFQVTQTLIETRQFDCFGGTYYPFYPSGRPDWLPDSFGRKKWLTSSTQRIDINKDGFLSGGIIAIKREVAISVGGFTSSLGMRGNNVGYGEEDDLQKRLQTAGYRIGFVPDWWMYHAVLPHKLQLTWHLKSAFARGRDAQRLHRRWTVVNAPFYLLKGLGGLLWRFLQLPWKWWSTTTFYWQNAVLFVIEPFCRVTGSFIGTYTGFNTPS